jgi:hypothetical protein
MPTFTVRNVITAFEAAIRCIEGKLHHEDITYERGWSLKHIDDLLATNRAWGNKWLQYRAWTSTLTEKIAFIQAIQNKAE